MEDDMFKVIESLEVAGKIVEVLAIPAGSQISGLELEMYARSEGASIDDIAGMFFYRNSAKFNSYLGNSAFAFPAWLREESLRDEQVAYLSANRKRKDEWAIGWVYPDSAYADERMKVIRITDRK